jgi:hypothetical protein
MLDKMDKIEAPLILAQLAAVLALTRAVEVEVLIKYHLRVAQAAQA